jgi:hypothetical protein
MRICIIGGGIINVYFSPSVFDIDKPKIKGTKINVNWEFVFANKKYRIPVLFYYPQGLIFDMITILDNDKVQKFYEKYNQGQQLLKNEFIDNQEENPMQMIHLENIMINNQPAHSDWKSSSSIYMPWSSCNQPELYNLRKSHNFLSATDSCFYCIRTFVKFNIMPQMPFQIFSFSLRKSKQILPIKKQCKHTVGESVRLQKIEFVHPVTQQEHHLYIDAMKIINCKTIYPYCIKLEYELEPKLRDGERLLFRQLNRENNNINVEQYTKNIIGGANGIATIQTKVSSVTGKRGLPLHINILNLCHNIPKEIQFSIDGIYTPNYQMKNFSFSFDNLVYNSDHNT